MPSENSGPPVRRPQPQSESAQAARQAAALAATRAEEARDAAARAAARAAAQRAEAERAAAQRRETERENRRLLPPPTPPYTYPGHYGQQPTTGGGGSNNGSGGSNNGSGGTDNQEDRQVVLTPMDPPPEPVAPITPAPVRTPTRNVTDISSLVPQFSPEHIAKILFENVSAIELSISERHDTIEGINQKYSIISNLSEIRKKYDAAKQLSTMDKLNPLTSIYAINIEDKIPKEDYIKLESLDSTYTYFDENNQLATREKGYYYIDTNGDLVIELINLERSQEVEVYIDTNGTIYKIDKVES
jgi:hypothetical protein